MTLWPVGGIMTMSKYWHVDVSRIFLLISNMLTQAGLHACTHTHTQVGVQDLLRLISCLFVLHSFHTSYNLVFFKPKFIIIIAKRRWSYSCHHLISLTRSIDMHARAWAWIRLVAGSYIVIIRRFSTFQTLII